MLFFSAGQDDSFAEPEETDSEDDDDDDAKNERDKVDTTGKEMDTSHSPLCRSIRQRWPPSPSDEEIREECKREDELPCVAKWTCICLAYKINEGFKRKKKYSCPNTLI